MSEVQNSWSKTDFVDPLLIRLPFGQIISYTTRCPGKNSVNEDSLGFRVHPRGLLFCVADGAGGHAAGEQASTALVDALVDGMFLEKSASVRSGVLDAIESANSEILKLKKGAGSTVIAANYRNGRIRFFQVGDSPAIVFSATGKLKYQSIAHSPIGYGVASGNMKKEEAIHHPLRHLVTNLVGTKDMYMEVSVRIDLAKRDTVMLASDGIFDNLFVDEVINVLTSGDLLKNSKTIVEKAFKRMDDDQPGTPHKPDDMSFILFRQF